MEVRKSHKRSKKGSRGITDETQNQLFAVVVKHFQLETTFHRKRALMMFEN